ncbi:DUF4145 domain-containing protein [Bosea sp. LjRoot237]|uniref:DUF4145 domain-containing protein n=1 Tax=Bosea sp. LjRoot237 TaxID=3342292 RepID=UPI003ED0755E
MLHPGWWLSDAQPQHWIALFAVVLIIIDSFVKPLTLVALGLSVLAVLPWLLRFVKRLELPGGVSVEMQQLEEVAEKAKDAGLLPHEPADRVPTPAYQAVFNDDPILALAGLRIELERRLNALFLKSDWEQGKTPSGSSRPMLPQQVRWLRSKGVLTPQEASVISDLLPLLNAAVHSRELTPEAAKWAMDNGPSLLASLDKKVERASEDQMLGQPQGTFSAQ